MDSPSESLSPIGSPDIIEDFWTPKFVDKSLFIKEVFDAGSRILLTAPSQFGKSTNLDMLNEFVSIKANKTSIYNFYDLNIYKYDKRFFEDNYQQHPVLYLKFTNRYTNDYEGALSSYRLAIHNAYLDHEYLMRSKILKAEEVELCEKWCNTYDGYKNVDEKHVLKDLENLVAFIKREKKKQVIVLIDQYDSVVNLAMHGSVNDTEYEGIVNLTSLLIRTLLKGNADVCRAVLTGVSCVTTTGLSDIVNLKLFPFLGRHAFDEFYGFTEDEVHIMLKKKVSAKEIRDREIENNLNVYLNKRGQKIFNPLSVNNYLNNKDFSIPRQIIHWVTKTINAVQEPEVATTIAKLLKRDEIQFKFINRPLFRNVIVLKNSYKSDVRSSIDSFKPEVNIDIFMSHMFELGLITYTVSPVNEIETEDEDTRFSVEIPNIMMSNLIFDVIFERFRTRILEICDVSIPHKFIDTCDKFFNMMDSSYNLVWMHLMNKDHPSFFDKMDSSYKGVGKELLKEDLALEH